MLQYKSFKIGEKPRNLLVFLHGYNDSITKYNDIIKQMSNKLKSAYVFLPESSQFCDKNTNNKQWFGILKYDANSMRRDPNTSVEDIFTIYDKAQDEIAEQSVIINDFLNNMQKQYKIEDNHTYLCGFSQGAMLTIYTALTRKKVLAGCFVFSGLVAAAKKLSQNIISRPKFYFFHGEDDLKVQYKTLPESLRWMKIHNIDVKYKTYPQLAHQLNEDEINIITEIINENT